MTPSRLRAIKWSVAYLSANKKIRCRCSGTCDRCKEYARHEENTSFSVLSELIDIVENAQRAKESEQ